MRGKQANNLKAVGIAGLVAVVVTILPGGAVSAQAGPYNPVQGGENFLIFVEGNATLTTNENEGTIAIGGNLIAGGGPYQIGNATAGVYTADAESRPSALVIAGTVDFAGSSPGGIVRIVANSNVNIGDMTGITARNTDNNNASVNTRVLPSADYNATPRVELTVSQAPATVHWQNPITFSTAFSTFRSRSAQMGECLENVTLIVPGNGPAARPVLPATGQLNITITPGQANILNLTGAELNNIGVLNFTNAPASDSPLVINVDTRATGGVFAWTGFTFAGSFDPNYILFNFPDAIQITQTPNAPTVEGTIYAPDTELIDNSQSNTEGSIIAKSLAHNGGEMHNFPFEGTVSCQSPATPSTAASPSPSAGGPLPSGSALPSASSSGPPPPGGPQPGGTPSPGLPPGNPDGSLPPPEYRSLS